MRRTPPRTLGALGPRAGRTANSAIKCLWRVLHHWGHRIHSARPPPASSGAPQYPTKRRVPDASAPVAPASRIPHPAPTFAASGPLHPRPRDPASQIPRQAPAPSAPRRGGASWHLSSAANVAIPGSEAGHAAVELHGSRGRCPSSGSAEGATPAQTWSSGGHGDPRWIVEEREDGTNVNNGRWCGRAGAGAGAGAFGPPPCQAAGGMAGPLCEQPGPRACGVQWPGLSGASRAAALPLWGRGLRRCGGLPPPPAAQRAAVISLGRV